MLTEIACPNCLNPIDIRQYRQYVTCNACGSQFLLAGHVCPSCNAYHQQPQPFCGDCGQALSRVCLKCQTSNWAGDEYCKNCGAAMDIFQLLQKNYAKTTADRLQQQMDSSAEIKATEQKASEQRMARMMADEQERQRDLARRRTAQRQKDQQLFLIVGILAVLVTVIVILLTAL
jgi:hypothetical protein